MSRAQDVARCLQGARQQASPLFCVRPGDRLETATVAAAECIVTRSTVYGKMECVRIAGP